MGFFFLPHIKKWHLSTNITLGVKNRKKKKRSRRRRKIFLAPIAHAFVVCLVGLLRHRLDRIHQKERERNEGRHVTSRLPPSVELIVQGRPPTHLPQINGSTDFPLTDLGNETDRPTDAGTTSWMSPRAPDGSHHSRRLQMALSFT